MSLEKGRLQEYARSHRGAFEDLLARFVEVPSVSADPDRKPDIEKVAQLAASTLRDMGGQAEIHRVEGGSPVVLGGFGNDPSRPTVTVYNHMDVQPASKETEPWVSEPFAFTRAGDKYLGRGTTDDKGPALTALYGARAAVQAGVPVNLKFLWETEEEVGSPHFAETLKKIGAAAATDVVVVSDTVWVSREQPSLSAGLRGLLRLHFRLETAETDQHSGTTGGAARNPIAELCQLAADMFDARTGRVKIPGFYADVAKLTGRQIRDFRASGFSVKKFVKDHGFKSIRTNDALDVMKRIWALPTFEIHGIVGGYTGPGIKTIVPPRAEMKVSVRLVPDMDGEKVGKIVKAFVKKRNPDVQVEVGSSAPAYKGITEGPYVDAARKAVKFAFGKDPVFVREGGTIGAVLSMEQILKVPIVFLGLSLPEHGYHAPNENFDWGQAGGGMVAFAKLFEEMAAVPRGGRVSASRRSS